MVQTHLNRLVFKGVGMKRGQIIELNIDSVRYPNKGIGCFEGKEVQVKNVIKGQRVEVRIKKKRTEYVEGKLMRVLEASDIEVPSFCEHFGKCGGCSLQTLPYDAQVKMKSDMVKKLLDDNNIKYKAYKEIVLSPEIYDYRNKMEFSFGDEIKGGDLQLGMHKKGRMHDVVNVPNCHICHDDFTKIAEGVLNFSKAHYLPKYNKNSHEGLLRHLTIRKGTKTNEILIGLSATTQYAYDEKAFVDMLLALPLEGEIVGILHILNDGMGDVVQGPIKILYGRDYYYENLYDLKFKVSFFSFFQTNTLGAEVLYKEALKELPDLDNKVVFDLFSGTGTIGQVVSKNAKEVIGIELVESAVEAAKENADLNKITNTTFIAGDVFDQLDHIKTKPDIIILDPPRMGILEKTMHKIIKYKVKEMLYISCNPKTLVENLVQLQKAGYSVENVFCVDMFPHVSHVETIVKLVRN